LHSGSISIQRRMTAMEIDEKKNAETLELMDLIQREPRVFEILKAAAGAKSG